MERSALIALDIGSSSVRSTIFRRDLEQVDGGAASVRRISWRTGAPGAMDIDAEELFGHVVAVLDGAVERARELRLEVEAVALTSFWHSLLGLDAAGTPATPLYGWGDSRAGEAASRLRRKLDPQEYHLRTGCFIHPAYPATKLAWLSEREPSFAAVRAWVSFGEYLEGRLLGVRRCSVSMASGTGLFGISTGRWDGATMEAVGVSPDRLGELVDLEAATLRVPQWRARWPELADAAWFPTLGDGACANVGTGAIGPGEPGVTIGTTAAARVLWEPRETVSVPEALWCYRLDTRRWVAGGALSSGGNTLEFLRGISPGLTHGSIDRALANAQPAGHGLVVIPTLVGERAFNWAGEVGGAIVGLRLETRPEELVQAFMEAISYRIQHIVRELEASFGAVRTIHASGGALHAYPRWTGILADVLDRPVRLGAEREATSRGAAIVAAESLGWLTDIEGAPLQKGMRVEPDPARHRSHRAAAERQRDLDRALRPHIYPDRVPVGTSDPAGPDPEH